VRVLALGDHVERVEVVVDVHAEVGPRRGALLLGELVPGLLARQVADVADAGLDGVARAEIARDGLRLGRRLDDHEAAHVSLPLLLLGGTALRPSGSF
jgi:hypothetical protein